MSTRRQRFTVEFTTPASDEVQRVAVLAYSAADADEWVRSGRARTDDRTRRIFDASVVRVIKGDYRVQRKIGQGFRVNPAAIEEAQEFFGLKFPVAFKFSKRRGGGRHGQHAFMPCIQGQPIKLHAELPFVDGWMHVITLTDDLDPQWASHTLWHELQHAQQSERVEASVESGDAEQVMKALRAAYSAGRTRYDRKPWEVEANETADTMNDVLRLAGPR